MGLAQQRVQAWKWLMSQVAKIQDPILRNTTKAEFKQRALRDWGYCPEDGMTSNLPDVELDPWEQEFVADLKAYHEFGVDLRKEKRKATQAEAIQNMREFIRNGGTLADIPADVRSPHIDELYYECLVHMGKDTMAQADNVIAAGSAPVSASDQDPFCGEKPTLEKMVEWLRNGGFWLNLPFSMQTQENKTLYMQALGQL